MGGGGHAAPKRREGGLSGLLDGLSAGVDDVLSAEDATHPQHVAITCTVLCDDRVDLFLPKTTLNLTFPFLLIVGHSPVTSFAITPSAISTARMIRGTRSQVRFHSSQAPAAAPITHGVTRLGSSSRKKRG